MIPHTRRLKITIECSGTKHTIDNYYEGDIKTFANTLYQISSSLSYDQDTIDQVINCEYNDWKYFNNNIEDEN